ncbi:GDYXXLXY domain-containing protein [Hoeflea sp. YIM 152468]|uniref:GDYXXLXY domain-containing protein n=1 Tax=Hoeflea sp. YIM 152468 TaxID=3031759 RepID=UPI0023DA0D71|nr:GDYXXLXY domain-containing protein [Hoeflea sp. YIM 152468]MDF1609909.1 GDYXXLXY domain-containing protein [Hoeflea sp. YIM 152468]
MTAISQMLRRDINPFIAAMICAIVLIGMLGVMIGGRVAILRNGFEVVLKAAPVDPRDLMRGDYVELRYEDISMVNGALLAADWPKEDTYAQLWLTLERSGEDRLGKPSALSLRQPDYRLPGAVYLKSKPVMVYADDRERAGEVMFPLRFGIERYYVPEGEGLEIESARNDGRTTVAVRISQSGKAQIARLMIDGETLYSEPLY